MWPLGASQYLEVYNSCSSKQRALRATLTKERKKQNLTEGRVE